MISEINNNTANQYELIKEKLKENKKEESRAIDECADELVLTKKGNASYIEEMDGDKDGKITYKEFKSYCEKHHIDSKVRASMLETMKKAKIVEDMLNDEDEEEDDENKIKEEEKEEQSQKDDKKELQEEATSTFEFEV